jgi:hypothetical protein
MRNLAVSLPQHSWAASTLDSRNDFDRAFKIIGAFVVLTLLLLAIAPALLRPLFPVSSCLVGYWIYKRNESYYLSFFLWICMLAPLLRRVVDWRVSYQTQSIILLAPLLLTLLPAIHLRRRLELSAPAVRTGALFALTGIAFGAGVGMIKHPGVTVVLATVMWSAPIVLCVFVASIRDRETLGRVLGRTFLWGVLLMSAYGIFQYLVAPQWDTYWLREVSLDSLSPSFGHPEPFGIRVWSTMNSPGSFSLFLGAALIWLCTLDGFLATLACVAGYLTLSITLVRSAWIMTVLGSVIYALGCRKRASLRSTTIALVTVGIVALALYNAPRFAGVFDRFQTFASLKSDGSVGQRIDMYNFMRDFILSTPLGIGLQSTGVVHGYLLDSSAVEVFAMLGWPGAMCYLFGFGYILLNVALSLRSFSNDLVAAAAIVFTCTTQVFSGNAFYQQGGMVLWMFIGVWGAFSARYALPTAQTKIIAMRR